MREAVGASFSLAETLRRLGLCPTGGNARTLKKRISLYGISTMHFDQNVGIRRSHARRTRPLSSLMVENSDYSRSCLKRRLFREGLKERRCERCGQGEIWMNRRMSLILDHVNGIRNDHRLENLRIVCPNCAATLDTHCGRKNRLERDPRACELCHAEFIPSYPSQRFCSRRCGTRSGARAGGPRPWARKVERPPYEQLLAEIEATNFCAVGRKYGVSDNAVRKWVRQYEREAESRRG